MSERVTILLVEDNDGDAKLVKEGFQRLSRQVRIVESGEEARAFLEQCGSSDDFPEPGLILIDLGLPGMSGHSLIKWIRGQPRLRPIPVVVLTASGKPTDSLTSYELGANAHIVKPFQLDALVELVNLLDRFWVELVNHQRLGSPGGSS